VWGGGFFFSPPPPLLVGALLLVGAAAIALYVSRGDGTMRYAPQGVGYSFDVPAGFDLVYVKEASPPEGTPVSAHQSAKGIVISARWDGENAARRAVNRATVDEAMTRMTGIISTEEASNRDRVRRRGRAYRGSIRGPNALELAGFPALHFMIERTEANGVRMRSESYVVFKGRTPFRLECIRPLRPAPEGEARSACDTVIRSLELGKAPITG
jgi:hypothetical protein